MNRARDPRTAHGRTLGMLLAILTSIGLVLLVLEGGLRLLPIPLAAPVVGINDPHDQLGWAKRKGASTEKSTAEFDITFRINELGLRDDDDLTHAKPSGEKRVLVVGDSFVLGYTVSRDELFVDRVERAFAADERDVQVLNGGTEGYATDQELIWLEIEGLKFEPDVVVLAFYQNDVYWNGQDRYAGTAKPRFPLTGDADEPEALPALDPARPGWAARHTALGGLFYNLGRMSLGQELVHALGEGRYVPKEEMVVFTNFPDGAGKVEDAYLLAWKRTETCLRGFARICADEDVPLLALAIPAREHIHEAAANSWLEDKGLAPEDVDFSLPSTRFLQLAEEAGIPTLDPTADLAEAAAGGARLYFEQDWHLNGEGNRVLAAALYERLCADEFLGGGAKDSGKAELAAAGSTGSGPVWPYVLVAIWLLLGVLYSSSYKDERLLPSLLKIGAMIGVVVAVILLVDALAGLAGPAAGAWIALLVVFGILGFVFWKSRTNLGIITEVYTSFVRHGHWYMIPLLVVMLAIGSLLIVASSSPFVAPFIYTLF